MSPRGLVVIASIIACGKDAPPPPPPVSDLSARPAKLPQHGDAPAATGVLATTGTLEVVVDDGKYSVRSTDGLVTIAFAGEPVLLTRSPPSGLLEWTTQDVPAASHDLGDGSGFGVVAVKVGALDEKTVTRVIDAARDGRVPLFNGKLKSDDKVQIGGRPGRRLVIHENHGTSPTVLRQWLVYVPVQQILYIIDASHEPDDPASARKLDALVAAIAIK